MEDDPEDHSECDNGDRPVSYASSLYLNSRCRKSKLFKYLLLVMIFYHLYELGSIFTFVYFNMYV